MKSGVYLVVFVGLGGLLRAEEDGPSRTVRIPCATWFHGFVHMAAAFVVGEVTGVSEAVSDIEPGTKIFNYSLAVSAYGGDCPELTGVTEIQSENGHPVKAGEWVILFINYYEKKPDLAAGSRQLDLVKGVNDPLAKLFIAKGADYSNYTPEDMLMLKERMPADYRQILPMREWRMEQSSKRNSVAPDRKSPPVSSPPSASGSQD